MPRLIAIGDVHGCDLALSRLLELIQPSPTDTIVQLGDLIDRGPNSRAVIDHMIALKSNCRVIQLLGDHEELMLNTIANPKTLSRWRRNGGTETLKSYGWSEGAPVSAVAVLTEHAKYLESARDYYEADQHVFVHAGYVSDLAWDDQPVLALRWRTTSAGVTQPHYSGKNVVCGHTAQKLGEILELPGVTCIDTNCVRGGWLTALDVLSNTIWQVDLNGVPRGNETRSLLRRTR